MKLHRAHKTWLAEGKPIYPHDQIAVYLAADVDARMAELEGTLRTLLDVAHREVSPKYSAELDEAFTRADAVLGVL